MHRFCSRMALLCVTLAAPTFADSASIVKTVEVSAGDYDRSQTPVFFDVPGDFESYDTFQLKRTDTNATIAAQRLPGKPSQLVWMIDELLPAGATRRYELIGLRSATTTDSVPQGRVAVVDDQETLTVQVDGKPVLKYHQKTVESPAGLAAHYRRSGHIHPLFNPAGQAVTDDFPPDHAHQHAVFFPWVNTTFEGRNVDFWNQAKGTGKIEHVRTGPATDGPVFGQIVTYLRHSDLTAPSGPKPVLDEEWTVRVYRLADPFIVDFESRQSCASDQPLTINQFHYGGMGFRGSRPWFKQPESGFLTSEGKNRANGNHTRPNWVAMFGQIEGQTSGFVAMGHPTNFRFPQPVRLHPDKPYYCFAPMVLGAFDIVPGQPYESRYRICVFNGAPDPKAADRIFRDYSSPAMVRVAD